MKVPFLSGVENWVDLEENIVEEEETAGNSIFCFSNNVFESFLSRVIKNIELFGKGIKILGNDTEF